MYKRILWYGKGHELNATKRLSRNHLCAHSLYLISSFKKLHHFEKKPIMRTRKPALSWSHLRVLLITFAVYFSLKSEINYSAEILTHTTSRKPSKRSKKMIFFILQHLLLGFLFQMTTRTAHLRKIYTIQESQLICVCKEDSFKSVPFLSNNRMYCQKVTLQRTQFNVIKRTQAIVCRTTDCV